MQTVLLVSPYKWGVMLANFYRASTNGVVTRLHGLLQEEDVDTAQVSAPSSLLLELLRLSHDLAPSTLYSLAGKRSFKHERDFWEKADENQQRYVKQIADRRLVKLLRKLAETDIPIYSVTERKQEIFNHHALTVSLEKLHPCMHFERTTEGVNYTLTLQTEQTCITPMEHTISVLASRPGAVAIDKNIYLLDEHFSGKLLLPFAKKATIEVAKRMEKEYFHRFILKNASAADIEAEGFEMVEVDVQPKCQLKQEQDTLGNSLLSIQFVYADRILTRYDKQQCYVRLEEIEDGYRFLQMRRDAVWEQHCFEVLRQEADGAEMNDSHLRFPSAELMVAWMRKHGETLQREGIEVGQPTDQRYYFGRMDWKEEVEQKGDWLHIHAYIQLVDGRKVTLLDLRDTLLQGKQEHTLPDGTVLVLPHEWTARFAPLVMTGQEVDGRLRVHYTQMEEQYASASGIVDIPDTLPTKLKAQLRPYQEEGYRWLLGHLAQSGGCCLSDEMGLGKTLQTIALLLRYKEVSQRPAAPVFGMLFSEDEMQGKESPDGTLPQRTSLVIAPTSVVYNWREELQRFAPSLSVMTYIGTPEERSRKRTALTSWDIVITTYRTLANDIRYFSNLSFGILVMDESQAFKNRDSQLHAAVSRLQGLCRIALSGTPVENGLSELWSLMHILQPMLLGSFSQFGKQYLQPIHHSLESVRTKMLRRMIAPYMLKRTKEEVLTELPERQDELIVCPMTPEQESVYVEALSSVRNDILEEKEHQSARVLAAIQALRQIACHPLLVGKCEERKSPSTTNTDKTEKDAPQNNGYPVNTSTFLSLSGKAKEVFHRLDALRGTSHKVLLFSEYVRFLHLISEEMTQRGWKHEMLTGETQNREQVIRNFQNDEGCQFFLVSLKAGGVGLNLTEADYVFLLDPWWNRAAEEQAISRAHRIGQQRSVFVYRFVSENTLEQQVLAVQEEKQNVIDAVLPFLLH